MSMFQLSSQQLALGVLGHDEPGLAGAPPGASPDVGAQVLRAAVESVPSDQSQLLA